jgi:LysR family hydrogen peroxide-inducible transcriptional activator
MNLRDLHYVCSVADLGHFGRAAEANHVSQPTLSGQIAKLEDSLGVTLFERTKRSVRLTSVGAEIVAVAREILGAEDLINRIAQAHRDPLAEPLRIGVIPTIAPYLIPILIAPLRKAFPGLKTVFIEEMTDPLLSRLAAGTIDTAIIATEEKEAPFASISLYREPFWLAVPRGHALEHTETITLDAIDPAEMLFLNEGHCFREQALALCGTTRQNTDSDMAATSLETVLNLVGAGQGITLVPALAARGAWTTDLGVIVRALDQNDAMRDVNLTYRKAFPRGALLEELALLIRDTVPNTLTPLT